MKVFYDTRYRFYNRHVKKPLCFFLISDIHFAPKVTSQTLDSIVKIAKQKHPDYILIPGDLVDHLDNVNDKADLARLLAWLERLGKIATTIIGLGNHDFYRIDESRKPKFFSRLPWRSSSPELLVEHINAIKNVHLLDNSAYEDDRIYVFGFTQSPEYFSFEHKDDKREAYNPEDPGILLHDLSKIPAKQLHQLPPTKVKIALAHSPFRLLDDDIAPFFADFDHIISGHTHNGVVPPVINDFWRSDRGLVAPGNRVAFPPLSRSGCFGNRHQLIICGAVTTISDSTRKLKFLNAAFPVNVATLEISKNIAFVRKPNVSHKYINPSKI